MNPKDLLVVDDEFSVLYTIRAILENDYPEMECFSSPNEALAFLKREGGRVVLTDFRMPEMSGIDMLREVVAIDPDIQIIMLTAHGSEKVAVDAMKIGAYHYITKPFDPEELKIVVQKAMEQFHQRKKAKYDMEMAQNLQLNLIPQQSLQHGDFRLTFKYFPSGNVGGDFFDFYPFSDGSLGVIIADAVGHGVASAMLMAMLKMVCQNTMLDNPAPSRLLHALNKQFYPVLKSRSYFTAFYAIFYPQPRRMVYSSAGHPFPMVFHKKDGSFYEDDISGMGIGMFPASEYQQKETQIEKGDCVLFYTDGLTDFLSEENFSRNLRSFFSQLSYNSTHNIVEEFFKACGGELAKMRDDVTLLLFQN